MQQSCYEWPVTRKRDRAHNVQLINQPANHVGILVACRGPFVEYIAMYCIYTIQPTPAMRLYKYTTPTPFVQLASFATGIADRYIMHVRCQFGDAIPLIKAAT